jgi:peptidoglycan hydrolase-like protein with peptidoglycan-binding domain
MRRAALIVCAALLVAGCGSDKDDGGASTTEQDPLAAAQRRVSAAEDELAEAQAAFDDASATFCEDSQSYVESADRYGSLFGDAAVTVGDVTTAGADLERPREAVQSSAGDVLDAHERLVTAEQELAEAQAALAEAESGTSAPDEADSTTTTEPLVPEATVDRVKRAEDDLSAAFEGVTPETPLTEATQQVNAAAFALQVAWLRLFADAGCLTDEQQATAVDAIASYTTALQTDLQTAGYLDGAVDGVYGPETVAAVEALQTASGLPVTGFVDRATAAALDAAVQAAGGEAATQAVAHTAALQTALMLAGYWDGPIDGQWSDALTAALESLQRDLGVPVTGVVDAATLEAMQRAIEEARTPPPATEPPTTEPPTTEASDDGPGDGPPATAVE